MTTGNLSPGNGSGRLTVKPIRPSGASDSVTCCTSRPPPRCAVVATNSGMARPRQCEERVAPLPPCRHDDRRHDESDRGAPLPRPRTYPAARISWRHRRTSRSCRTHDRGESRAGDTPSRPRSETGSSAASSVNASSTGRGAESGSPSSLDFPFEAGDGMEREAEPDQVVRRARGDDLTATSNRRAPSKTGTMNWRSAARSTCSSWRMATSADQRVECVATKRCREQRLVAGVRRAALRRSRRHHARQSANRCGCRGACADHSARHSATAWRCPRSSSARRRRRSALNLVSQRGTPAVAIAISSR